MIKFDKIYVISLIKKRPNKISEFMTIVPKDWNLGKIEIFDAVDGLVEELPLWWNERLKGSYGCYKSHMNILQQIIENGWENTMILEDDAIFCGDFIKRFEIMCENLPSNWEQFYLGGQHLSKPKLINFSIVRGTNINRTHCYIIKNKDIAKKIINYLSDKDFWITNLTKTKYHIDYAYGVLHKQNKVVCYASNPFLVGQQPNSFSDTGSQISRSIRWWN